VKAQTSLFDIPEGLWETEQYFQKQYGLVAGVDEAGRGPLAGPVVAAAVVLPADLNIPELNDSKKISEKKRLELFPIIKSESLAWAIASASPVEIDEINILNATFLAMRRCLQKVQAEHVLVDGNHKIREYFKPQSPIVKGDGRVLSIAAASILAKVTRDKLMEIAHQEYPEYFWDKNKGYPSKPHQEAILAQGWTRFHRRSFKVKNFAQKQIKERETICSALGSVIDWKSNA
jgi:ribonuclease HII